MTLKYLQWTAGLVLAAGAAFGLAPEPAQAQSSFSFQAESSFSFDDKPNVTYECLSDSQGVPTTYARLDNGNGLENVPVIRWKDRFFGSWTPTKRCIEVSQRLQAFHQADQLRFLVSSHARSTTGTWYPVICTLPSADFNDCGGLLITLRPNEDADVVLRDLLATGSGQTGALTRSSSQVRVDLNAHVRNTPPERAFPLRPE